MEVQALKERTRRIWDKGDYSHLSKRLEPAATALSDACAVSAGQEVLDVAAGDGNFALACAREGASVIALDLAPGMVRSGRARSEREGLEIEWVEADAEELPFADSRFDCVGSVFGAMIAPRPEQVARELFRVVRPGGTVGLTAWVPQGMFADLFAIGRRFAAPTPGAARSEEWGDEAVVRERFAGLAARVDFERRTLTWTAPSPEALEAELGETAPTFVAAREGLSPDAFEELRRATFELIKRHNMATDGTLHIDAEYLISVARKRG
jgi:ubiquinone/menaquinone biosynthesis C-methylase UbiE